MSIRKSLRQHIVPLEDLNLFFSSYKLTTCLDVGCGTGLWPEYLLEKGIIASCDGVEIHSKYFRQEKNLKITPASELPNDKTYDLVSFFDVLHHVDDKENFLKNYINKYGKKGTLIFIKEMSPQNIFFKSMNRLHDLLMARQIISEVSMGELVTKLNYCELVASGTKRIAWYDHYWCLFRKLN